MCDVFEGMIDRAKDEYGVIIVAFCCDNDGGSQKGRKILVIRCPWLFVPPCCAHQVCDTCLICSIQNLIHSY